MTTSQIYQLKSCKVIVNDYPDVLNFSQLCKILGISANTGYQLLKSGKIKNLKVGREYRISKIHLMEYLRIDNCHHVQICG